MSSARSLTASDPSLALQGRCRGFESLRAHFMTDPVEELGSCAFGPEHVSRRVMPMLRNDLAFARRLAPGQELVAARRWSVSAGRLIVALRPLVLGMT